MKDFIKKIIDKINQKTKKIDKVIEKKIENFKKSSFEHKASLIIVLIFAIDTSFFISGVITYSSDNTVKLVKSLNKKMEENNSSKELKTFNIQNDFETISTADKVYFLNNKKDNVVKIYIDKNNTVSTFKDIPTFSIVQNLEPLLLNKDIPFYWLSIPNTPTFPISSFVTSHLFSIILFGGLIFILMQSSGISLGNNAFQKVYPKDVKGSMKDIIGYEDVKEEILQLGDLIKKRNKYKLYGIEDVFNILLTGKPGTGKSKIASYICKSLKIPMIVTTGNVDSKYVGSGVAHIRNIFKEAEKMAKADKSGSCIIFIDEGQGLLVRRGKHDNKWADDSANELLAHLEGVKTNKDINIIVIVASNFNENNFDMDEAMARRFKKKIHFRDPNLEERREIIKFYLKKVKSKVRNIDIDFIAKNMSGLTPAIIETIIQEAGLVALKNKEKVNTDNIMKAFENILIGQSDRKTTRDQEEIRKVISIHEMGHFIVDFDKYMRLNNNDLEKTKDKIKLLKISSEAIARSDALGYVLSEQDDMLLKSVSELEEEIMGLYGGVAAEELFYGKTGITTGSANDIERVTDILKHLVFDTASYVDYKLNISDLDISIEESEVLIKDKSEELYSETKRIVSYYKELIEYLAEILIDRWVLTKDEIFEEIELFYQSRGFEDR